MRPKIKLLLAYDGSEFGGWQRQKSKMPTAQGTLEAALKRLFREEVNCVGASRTDAGVHAMGQVAHFFSPRPIERYNLVAALNTFTPASLVVHRAWQAPDDFHALASSTGKVYRYRIWNSPTPTAIGRRYMSWIRRPLDLDYLNSCSQFLLGDLDFKSFQSVGTPVSTTVRSVWRAHWQRRSKRLVEFEIHGSGFLKQMVRNIIGTQLDLLWAGEPPETMKEILSARDRSQAGTTAPPEGLYLARVEYPRDLDKRCRRL